MSGEVKEGTGEEQVGLKTGDIVRVENDDGTFVEAMVVDSHSIDTMTEDLWQAEDILGVFRLHFGIRCVEHIQKPHANSTCCLIDCAKSLRSSWEKHGLPTDPVQFIGEGRDKFEKSSSRCSCCKEVYAVCAEVLAERQRRETLAMIEAEG